MPRPSLTAALAHLAELRDERKRRARDRFKVVAADWADRAELIRQVTHGDWPVASLEGVDEARQVAIFEANKDTPIERRLYEVSYAAPGEPKALTPAGGWQ